MSNHTPVATASLGRSEPGQAGGMNGKGIVRRLDFFSAGITWHGARGVRGTERRGAR